ncbi:hypothetical protein WJX73_001132 [Symbiochloris irregularis]|uniref:HMA domain-containing protein n=1 Tax=Symbiochloris irregularis TaxID=706552 RepID=A0AAW1PR16_9CHLO
MLSLTSFAASDGLILPCCGKGVQSGLFTQVAHDDHVGFLCEGKLYCNNNTSDCEAPFLTPHELPPAASPCKLLVEQDISHEHGPNCGHEAVLHNDHYDFLVGNELHHVVEEAGQECCTKGCLKDVRQKQVVRHGTLSVLRHRQAGRELSPALSAEPLLPTVVVTEDADGAAPQLREDAQTVIQSKLYVDGICCSSEIPLIKNLLMPLPGVKQVDVAVVTKTVLVSHCPALISKAALIATLNHAQLDASAQMPREQMKTKGRWIPPWNVCLATILLIISLIKFGGGPVLTNFQWIALASIVLTGYPIARKAVFSLKAKVLDINTLVVLATAGAIAIGDYVEAGAVVVLFSLAILLERRCEESAKKAIEAVIAMQPQTAVLAHSGEKVAVEKVEVGTQVVVKPGEQVPLDGTVVSGASSLDQSLLTGESVPVNKSIGDQVMAGTVNVGSGLLQINTTALAADGAVSRIATLVEQAASQQSPIETIVNRFAKVYTPVAVFTCLLLIIVPAAMGKSDIKHWVYLSLQVLVTACPCALVLSTPICVVAGLARGARAGVLIKGGVYLEALAGTKVVMFDKTGTLTRGAFSVAMVQAVDGGDCNAMLQMAGTLERSSAHPVAAAIVGHAAGLGLDLSLAVVGSQEIAGKGVQAIVQGRSVAVGNAKLMAEVCEGHAFPALPDVAEWASKATICYVVIDGRPAGVIAVTDTVRPEAAEAVEKLRKRGVQVGMLTGDNAGAANAIAATAGLDTPLVHSQLLPEDKLSLVSSLKAEHGTLVHVGDGVNDAPALAAADIGIAMGVAGSAMAVEAADVALFTDDLRCIEPLLTLARLVRRKVLENVAFAVVVKAAVLGLAAAGKFTLWGAVLADQRT